ncbi:MAG: nucleotidyltransferase family protein [Paracoccaceae bacterium]
MTPRAGLIFAAGFGTRMGALTRDRPKPLIEVAGRPLLEHALTPVREAGIGRIVVNAHYRADMLADYLGHSAPDVALSIEDPILETGGGLRYALPKLGPGPVVTMNSDAVWRGPNPVTVVCAAWDATQMDALLLCVPRARAVGHPGAGDFTKAGAGHAPGCLTRGGDLVYTGVQVINPAGLASIPDRAFSLNLAWTEMAARGRLLGVVYEGAWCDVGHPAGIPQAEALLTDVYSD